MRAPTSFYFEVGDFLFSTLVGNYSIKELSYFRCNYKKTALFKGDKSI